MLARLWWKEARTFWPIWAFLGLVSIGVQGLILGVGPSHELRSGALMPIALAWPVLYAFAVGAAAFAGERETRTLRFLDTLPVDRQTLWAGKTSFALASTLALALTVAGAAALETEVWDAARFPLVTVAVGFGVLLLEGIAWGLFWSSLVGTALTAAILAIVCAGLSLVATLAVHPLFQGPSYDTVIANVAVIVDELWVTAPVRLVAALVALALSGLVMTWNHRGRRLPRGRAVAKPRAEATFWTRPIALFPTTRSLVWETAREGRGMWLLLTGLGVAIVASLRDPLASAAVAVLASLVAGCSIFGAENRDGTQRFYALHGVRPTSVWLGKQLAWGAGMLITWALLKAAVTGELAAFLNGGPESGVLYSPVASGAGSGLSAATWSHRFLAESLAACGFGYGVGQLCGLAIRRGITASVVGAVLTLLLLGPQLGLVGANMLPLEALTFTPLTLLFVSWTWTGDWIHGSPGVGRWVRRTATALVPLCLLFASYAGYRVWEVPDPGPPFDVTEFRLREVLAPSSAEADAGYLRAIEAIRSPDAPRAGLTSLPDLAAKADQSRTPYLQEYRWWGANEEAIALARRAASRPDVRLGGLLNTGDFPLRDRRLAGLRALHVLLVLDFRQRESRGDREGAWADVVALLRMGRQMPIGASEPVLLAALEMLERADRLGLAWATDPELTMAEVRTAEASLQGLPREDSLVEAIEREYLDLVTLLGRPNPVLFDRFEATSDPGRIGVHDRLFWRVLVSPWERARARRVARLVTAEQLKAGRPAPLPDAPAIARYEQTTPLMRLIDAPHHRQAFLRETVQWRALKLVLALRSWQLQHHGTYPSRLEELGSSALSLEDPYSGREFGYVRSQGQSVVPPDRWFLLPFEGRNEALRPTRPGQWLLYSVGPDGQDHGGQLAYANGDLIYPLPELPE